MLHTLQQMLAPAAMSRATLLLNHVLGSESVALQRLKPHAGKLLRIETTSWPSLLPPPPPLAWRITPAGLLEWAGEAAGEAPALRLEMAADNPALLAARLLGGQRPQLDVSGDAQFAGDVSWLIENLRWDLGADLERVFPPAVAGALQKAGSAVGGALKLALQGLASWRQGRP